MLIIIIIIIIDTFIKRHKCLGYRGAGPHIHGHIGQTKHSIGTLTFLSMVSVQR